MERPTVKTVLENGTATRVIIETNDNQVIDGFLSEQRLNRDNDTDGKYIYDIRHIDNDWCEPATIENRVLVNWFGCLITEYPILFPDETKFLTISKFSYE